MTNIEIPEEIQSTVQRILNGREFQMGTTVELAEFIHGLYKPEIEVEDFVIYKVKLRGHDDPRMGFRVSRGVPFPWVTLGSAYHAKENAYATSANNLIHSAEEITVIERWTPEAPGLEFGIGEKHDAVDREREVLVKGVLGSETVDSDGDVLVKMEFSQGLTESHYVNAADIAYAEEA